MINLPLSDVRIFLCATPIHMHCSFDTLMGLVPDGVRSRSFVGPLVLVLQPRAEPGQDRIGEDITRELELQPAKLEAHIHVRPKYACRYCRDGVCAGPLPPRPIPGGIAGPGFH